MARWFIALGLVLGACKPADPVLETCTQLCTEMVVTCGFDAYPDLGSCLQGCEFNESEGADIDDQLDCVLDAECDTFEMVECEHEEGID